MISSRALNIILSLLCCFILHKISYSPYGDAAHNLSILSSFFIFITSFPIILNKKIQNIYILPFITLNWVYFQSPFLLEEKTSHYPRKILAEHIPDISFFFCLSIIFIYIGYFYFIHYVKPISSTKLKFKKITLNKLVYLFILISIVYRVGLAFAPSITSSLSNVIQILFYSPTIAIALYSLYLIRNKIFPSFSLFHVSFFLFFIFEILYNVSTTMFVSTALLFSGVVIVYFYEKRKIPIIYILASCLLLAPYYLARTYYRAGEASTNLVDDTRIEKGFETISEIYDTESRDDIDKYYNRVEKNEKAKKNRLENLSFIGQVVYHHTYRNKPFFYGESFYWLPVAPIPRIIFPYKPENLMSTTVAESYGVRGKGSRASINFPMLIEAYANFGFIGIPIMALFFGMAIKWFVMKFGVGVGDINIIIIINCLKQLIHAEGNITLVFGAFIQIFIFWWVLLKILKINNKMISI